MHLLKISKQQTNNRPGQFFFNPFQSVSSVHFPQETIQTKRCLHLEIAKLTFHHQRFKMVSLRLQRVRVLESGGHRKQSNQSTPDQKNQTKKIKPQKRATFIWLFKQGFHTWLHIKVGYFLFLVSRMINMWGKAEHIFFLKFHRKVKCPPFFNTHPQLTCEEFLLDTFSLPVLTFDWFSHCSIRLRHNNKKILS